MTSNSVFTALEYNQFFINYQLPLYLVQWEKHKNCWKFQEKRYRSYITVNFVWHVFVCMPVLSCSLILLWKYPEFLTIHHLLITVLTIQFEVADIFGVYLTKSFGKEMTACANWRIKTEQIFRENLNSNGMVLKYFDDCLFINNYLIFIINLTHNL